MAEGAARKPRREVGSEVLGLGRLGPTWRERWAKKETKREKDLDLV